MGTSQEEGSDAEDQLIECTIKLSQHDPMAKLLNAEKVTTRRSETTVSKQWKTNTMRLRPNKHAKMLLDFFQFLDPKTKIASWQSLPPRLQVSTIVLFSVLSTQQRRVHTSI